MKNNKHSSIIKCIDCDFMALLVNVGEKGIDIDNGFLGSHNNNYCDHSTYSINLDDKDA